MPVDLLGHALNPLQMLLTAQKWKAAIAFVENDPASADATIKCKGFYDKNVPTRMNILHIACKNQAPPSVLEALLKANDSLGLQKESNYQRLPLHVATLNECPPRAVGCLVNACPESTKVQDNNGRLPIHYACRDLKNGERALRYLLKVYPESVLIADDKGFLPLHVACRSGMPMTVINMLLRVAPETVLAKTNNGATPMHCARSVKNKGDVQAMIVDTLKQFSMEIKTMVEDEGYYSTAMAPGTASIASCGTSVSSFRCDYVGVVQHSSKRQDQIPEMIQLGDSSTSTTETGSESEE